MSKQKKFKLIRVSQETHDLIQDLEMAALQLAAAKGSVEEVHAAYSILTQRRLDLYRHIEELESERQIDRPIQLRF